MFYIITNTNMSGDKDSHQRKPNPIFENSTDYALGGSSEGIRVLASRRPFVDHPKPHQGVDLVRNGNTSGDRLGRNGVVRTFRLVVFLDGPHHGFIFAL